MSDFFKNNPIALRHCIRFEILQGNSIGQAYSNICTVLGEEVIDYKKFKIRFNHFSKKKFNDKEKPCAKILRDDKYALRVCILYESLKYQKDKSSVPIFEVFENFCKVIGVEDVLKYPEFEFWFYRFLNGEFDLNHERDEKKKIHELMNMPIDVMENIVKYLDILDRASLVQTSRSLQTFVEDQKLFHHTLNLTAFDDVANVSFGRWVNIKYTRSRTDCKKNFNGREKSVAGAFWGKAMLDLKSVLKNPKLYLNTLKISLYSMDEAGVSLDDLEATLKFAHHLNVKNLILRNYPCNRLSKILSTLKPGYLTTIDAGNDWNRNVDSMNTVFEMEQGKQAKKFSMGNYYIWPWHHLYHFTEFQIRLKALSVEQILQMKEVLFKSPDFEKCSLVLPGEIDVSIFEQEFGYSIRRVPYIYHYSIQNSEEYFEIKFKRQIFEVTRKKN